MRIKEALARVLKVCTRTKAHDAYQQVRFFSDTESRYVMAFDGTMIKAVTVDDSIPNALVDSDILRAAVKEKGELEIKESGYGNIEITSLAATYRIEGYDFNRSIKLPWVPGLNKVPGFSQILKVCHAASSKDLDLSVLNFTERWVEATDKERLARVGLAYHWGGLLPASAFKFWPKGDVNVGFTKQHGYFQVEDELRVVTIRDHKYPDTARIIPEVHEGTFVLVNTDYLKHVINLASLIPEHRIIILNLAEDALHIWACKTEAQATPVYQSAIMLSHRVGELEKAVYLDGKFLKQALKEVVTPNVKLMFSEGDTAPLQIESGIYTSCVWPCV